MAYLTQTQWMWIIGAVLLLIGFGYYVSTRGAMGMQGMQGNPSRFDPTLCCKKCFPNPQEPCQASQCRKCLIDGIIRVGQKNCIEAGSTLKECEARSRVDRRMWEQQEHELECDGKLCRMPIK